MIGGENWHRVRWLKKAFWRINTLH
jgi:hypothetical protein